MSGERIIDGLTDAIKVANCEHSNVVSMQTLSGQRAWFCSRCAGRFNRDPRNPSTTGFRTFER